MNALQLAKHFFSGRAGQGQSTVDRRKNKRVIVFGDAGSGQDCHQLTFFLGMKKPGVGRQNVQRVNAERIGCLTRISRPEKAVDGRLRQGGQAGGLNKMR